MMKNQYLFWAILVGVLVAAIALGADRPGAAEEPASIVLEHVRPAVEVISYDDTLGLLDTRTGAIYRLRGNLDNSSAPKHWKLDVHPVKEPVSGVLELQRATFNHPDQVFLVDVVSGRTWILNRRGGSTTTWDPLTLSD